MPRTPTILPFSGDRLREQRERQGLRQEDLARLTGQQGHLINRSTISHLEKGSRSPLARTMKVLADALGVEIDDLLDKAKVAAK